MKQSSCLAGSLIAAGVGLSFGIRLLIKTAKPKLVKQRDVVRLVDEIKDLRGRETDLTDRETAVLDSYQSRLTTIYNGIAQGNDTGVAALVAEVNRKLSLLPAWINGRRKVNAVNPSDLLPALQAKLDTVHGYLSSTADSDDDFKRAKGILDAMDSDIRQAVFGKLLPQITSFRTALIDRRKTTTNAVTLERIENILSLLEKSENEANSGQTLAALDAARVTFERARAADASILADGLRAELPSATPRGFDDAQWSGVRAQVIDRLDAADRAVSEHHAELAVDRYEDAIRIYLTAVADHLRRFADGRISALDVKIKQADDPTKKTFEDWKTELREGVLTPISRIADNVNAGRFLVAQQIYDEARLKCEALIQKLSGAGALGFSAAGPVFAIIGQAIGLPAAPAGVVSTPSSPPRLELPMATAWGLTWGIFLLELLYGLAVFVVALVIGLQLLWVNDPTWGGPGAWAIAFLWGMGLHQVAGSTIQGAGGVSQELIK